MWQILRAATHRRMPWKNGGGTTTEIAIEPPGAALTDFDWRVSMARIDVPGPFSAFPGIDRILLALEGRIDLHIEGRALALTPQDPPVAFAGEAQASADLARSDTGEYQPALDLNVMVRRERMSARLERVRFECETQLAFEAGIALVLSRTSTVTVGSHDAPAVLDVNDALLVRCRERMQLAARCREAGELVVCQFQTRG